MAGGEKRKDSGLSVQSGSSSSSAVDVVTAPKTRDFANVKRGVVMKKGVTVKSMPIKAAKDGNIWQRMKITATVFSKVGGKA